TRLERETLPIGAKLMTLECGVRFLTDYLAGDTYFHIHRPQHNLDRCRTQFKLVADMEQAWDDMAGIIIKYS
ncbi:MAG: mucin desulfatase, partial [Oscillospiraceae bacterium]